MKKLINLVAGLAAASLLFVTSVSPSYAAQTSFVSRAGNDGNPCTAAAPCRTIGAAIDTAGNGGIVSCLDAGPYTENNKSLIAGLSFTVDCQGVVYTSASNFAFSVVPSTGQVFTFRNVIFDGAPGGAGAVQIGGSARVVFENCTFQNFTASPAEAVQFAPSVAGAQLTITDSVFANNGVAGGGGGGIIIQPSGGITAGVVVERTQVTGNNYGIFASGSGGTVLANVRYSTIAGNALDGIFALNSGSVSVASIVVEHSASVRNGGSGAHAQGAGAYVALNDSTVAANAKGLTTTSGGLIFSFKNNFIGGNLSPGVTPTAVDLQ